MTLNPKVASNCIASQDDIKWPIYKARRISNAILEEHRYPQWASFRMLISNDLNFKEPFSNISTGLHKIDFFFWPYIQTWSISALSAWIVFKTDLTNRPSFESYPEFPYLYYCSQD